MGGDLGVAGRNETDAQRVGRNWNELLQELTGVSFEPTGAMGVHWTWGCDEVEKVRIPRCWACCVGSTKSPNVPRRGSTPWQSDTS